MTSAQKASLAANTARQELRSLALKEDSSAEDIEAKTKELGDLESRAAALVVSEEEVEPVKVEPTEDAEARELRSLSEKVSMGSYLHAAAEGRGVDGAEREYNAALGITKPNGFSLGLLSPREERATTNTDGQSTQSSRWVDRLFAVAAARHLGVTFESVAPGLASFPVTTAGATGEQQDRKETTSDAVWTVGVTELKPKRKTARAVFSVEDDYRMPGLEGALRRDMGMAVMDAVDASIFNGDDGPSTASYDIVGLDTAAITEVSVTQANKVLGAGSMAAFAAMVDGKAASVVEDLRVVNSVGWNTLWLSRLVQAGNSVDRSMAMFLKENGLSWMTRADIDENTAGGDFGAFVGLGRGIEGAAVAAVWSEGMLVRDPYGSHASDGEVALTLSYFWDFGVPRPANFRRVKFA